MINLFWKLLARIVATPWVVDLIIANSKTKPYFHLYGYMHRWWLTPRFLLTHDEDGNLFPYSWVPMILKCRVHHILRADNDRHLHDHPADNRSIILSGYYDEQDVFGRSNIRCAGKTVLRRAQCFHRIAYVPTEGTWTLWFLGEKQNDWGFLVEGRKVGYKTYLGQGK